MGNLRAGAELAGGLPAPGNWKGTTGMGERTEWYERNPSLETGYTPRETAPSERARLGRI
jgi:hypothetical protein